MVAGTMPPRRADLTQVAHVETSMTTASERWSTTHLPPAAQFAAWREVIVDAHLAWDIPGIDCQAFPAYMH